MKLDHLSEMEVQQCALNEGDSEMLNFEHLEECEDCKIKIASYKLLFSEIKQQPKPAFDFDLSTLVLAQLPQAKSTVSSNHFLISLLFFIALSVICITVYIFRKFIFNVFTGISSFFIYTILAIATIIIISRCIEMHKTYQKQMDVLKMY